MKILATERHINQETPTLFVKAGHDFFVPKEEVPGVHEFDRVALIQTIKDLKPDVLLIGLKFVIDQEIIDLGIKLVVTRTTGTDHITGKVEVIKLVGEELTDVVAVPELCLWAMLELVRKRGGQELRGKTLGIIGNQGRIGNILNNMATYLGMKVLGQDIKDTDSERVSHAGKLEVVLQNSDIISLNISSTEENRGFMDRAKFEMMKDGTYFLNSARPWLVDDEAFKWAMENKLAGAWVDFELGWTAKNLIQTNHQGGNTIESKKKTELIIANKVKD